MADKIKAIKIKQINGTYSEEIPISVNVQNVQWDENNHTLLDALGSVDISSSGKGNLQHQIDELDGDKISTNEFNSRLNDFLKDQISADTTDWLDDNVNPVGSAVIVDKTLTIDGAAADALVVKTELNKKANVSNTYTKAEVNAAIDAKKIEVDDTLSITGTAADAKAVGDELTAVKADLEELKPLTEDIKVALLNVASHIGLWSDGDGKKYYGALKAALYPYTGLVRISAVFTQGSAAISPSTPLNDLKAYLVVTGYYDDGTSKIITDYALSGTLEVGTSTITVSKENKTDTFDVVVSSSYWDYEWYASSGIAPLDINGNPAYGLFADGLFKLDESHPEFAYAESLPVEVAIEFVSIVKVNNIPMFSFCYNYDSDGGDGFKIFNNNDGKVQTSVSGSSIATETDFHVGSELQSIHAIVASTGCSFEFGDISGSGTGVFNNQWLLGNNIAYPRLNTGGDIRLKSIKFKYLT